MHLYRVVAGDTVPSLARKFSVSPILLREQNGLLPDEEVTEGQAIVVFPPAATHIVKEGETPKSVAARRHISLSRLLQYNPHLRRESELYPGQTLTVSLADPPKGTLTTVGFTAEGMEEEIGALCPFLSFLVILGHGFSQEGELRAAPAEGVLRLARERYVTPLLGLSSASLGEGIEEGEKLLQLLSAEAARRRLQEELLHTVKREGYGGVYLDFSFIPESAKEEYTSFVMQLRRRLASLGGILLCAIEARLPGETPLSPGEDTPSLGRAATATALGTHAFASRFSAPSPLTPLDKCKEAAKLASSCIRPEKLLLMLSPCGADFTVGDGTPGRHCRTEEALSLAKCRHSPIAFDPLAKCPYFTYCEDEARHIVFFEDAESLYEKLKLLERHRFLGVGLFPLLSCTPSMLLMLSGLFRIIKPHEE